ncbi:MAG TPA: hypothetical protein DCX89_03790 [Saprospirales bacterium]|nr:hypothetical protein [Saprospirales bacterium]HRQ28842.1 hypothetical protein [Saprospiraceae bacterium]
MIHKRPVQRERLFLGLILMMLIFVLILASCSDENTDQLPKPRAYPRVDFPEKEYRQIDREMCYFGFELPVYAEIKDYSGEIAGAINKQCWFDITIPAFHGKIHCSYYPINKTNTLDSLIFDSFTMVGQHTIKAQYIKETRIELPNKVYGVLFNLSGPAASPTQFFLTDSINHFFRGSLYFENKPQVDSMEVVYHFVNQDIEHLLNSFHWK